MPTYDVLYRKVDSFLRCNDQPNSIGGLVENYKCIKQEVFARDIEDLFWEMQAENWSPNGEMHEFIKNSGTGHTSMSTGDIAIDEDNRIWFVEPDGWTELFPDRKPFFNEIEELSEN